VRPWLPAQQLRAPRLCAQLTPALVKPLAVGRCRRLRSRQHKSLRRPHYAGSTGQSAGSQPRGKTFSGQPGAVTYCSFDSWVSQHLRYDGSSTERKQPQVRTAGTSSQSQETVAAGPAGRSDHPGHLAKITDNHGPCMITGCAAVTPPRPGWRCSPAAESSCSAYSPHTSADAPSSPSERGHLTIGPCFCHTIMHTIQQQSHRMVKTVSSHPYSYVFT
jgi:hypothetical protein